MILATGSGVGTALSLAAAGAYAVLAIGAHRLDPRTARWVLLLAWFLHAIVLGWTVLGGTPRFGFAPALSTLLRTAPDNSNNEPPPSAA